MFPSFVNREKYLTNNNVKKLIKAVESEIPVEYVKINDKGIAISCIEEINWIIKDKMDPELKRELLSNINYPSVSYANLIIAYYSKGYTIPTSLLDYEITENTINVWKKSINIILKINKKELEEIRKTQNRLLEYSDSSIFTYEVYNKNLSINSAVSSLSRQRSINRDETSDSNGLNGSNELYRVRNRKLVYTPEFKTGIQPTKQDGQVIFNSMESSEFVPYIEYYGHQNEENPEENVRLFKIFQSSVDYDFLFLPFIRQTEDEEEKINRVPHTIYFYVWIEKDSIIHRKATVRDNYELVRYDLISNKLFFSDQLIVKKKIMTERLAKTFPIFNIRKPHIDDIRGEYSIWCKNEDLNKRPLLNETVFYDLILNDDTLSLVYTEENGMKPNFLKIKIDINYTPFLYMKQFLKRKTTGNLITNPTVFSAMINNTKIIDKSDVNVYDPVTDTIKIVTVEQNKYYLNIVFRSGNLHYINEFQSVFDLILNYFHRRRIEKGEIAYYKKYYPSDYIQKDVDHLLKQAIYSYYIKTIPGITQIKDLLLKRKTYGSMGVRKLKGSSKIKQLKEIAGPLFDSKYYNKGKAEGYTRICQTKFCPHILVDNDEMVKKKSKRVLKYPRETGWYFYCPDDEYKYPYLKANPMENNKEFPYVPCCGKSDKTELNKLMLKKFEQGEPPELTSVNTQNYEKTNPNFLIGEGDIGNIYDIVKTYLGFDDGRRLGTPIDNNSAIHCCLIALKNKEYNRSKDRNKMVMEVRKQIKEYKSAMKQELYDYTDDQIDSMLDDPEEILSMNKYYRALEEIFNIDIFVFNGKEIELPRYDLYHIRNKISKKYYKERNTLIMMKITGSAVKSVDDHYDLFIVGNDKLFDYSIYSLCMDLINEKNKLRRWSNNNTELEINTFNLSDIIISKTRHNKLQGQYIDRYGKVRAIIYDGIETYTPPSQPVNVEQFIPSGKRYSYNEISTSSIITDLGENLKMNSYSLIRDVIDGIWIGKFYVKLESNITGEEKKLIKKLKIRSINTIGLDETNKCYTYHSIKNKVDNLIIIIRWLYEIYKIQVIDYSTATSYCKMKDGSITTDFADSFVSDYTSYLDEDEQNTVDVYKHYNTENVSGKLPYLHFVENGIKFLYDRGCDFVYDGRILFHNEIMMNKMRLMIKDYDRKTNGIPGNPVAYIKDESKKERALVLPSYNHLFIWLNSIRHEQKDLLVKTKLTIIETYMINPFFYKNNKDQIFLIYNITPSKLKDELLREDQMEKINKIHYYWVNSGIYMENEQRSEQRSDQKSISMKSKEVGEAYMNKYSIDEHGQIEGDYDIGYLNYSKLKRNIGEKASRQENFYSGRDSSYYAAVLKL